MRALIQRVVNASVSVSNEPVGEISSGLVIFIGIASKDTIEDSTYLVNKILNLRIFPDSQDHFSSSVLENNLELLIISQFTLYSDTRRGRRPGFSEAAPRAHAKDIFDQTVALFKQSPLKVLTGIFGEHMLINLSNDGPVTIWIDSKDRVKPRRLSASIP